jgi:hypothetical protein
MGNYLNPGCIMSATPHNIWRKPAYIPYMYPCLTNEAVAETERRIGFPLPKSLIELLKVQNGGYIRYTLEYDPGEHEQIFGIGSSQPRIDTYPMWDEVRRENSINEDFLIPFDGDGVHWFICLDYSENATDPSVVFVHHIEDCLEPIASSFDEYLSMLIPADEFNFYIPQVNNVEQMLHLLGASLFIDFSATPSNLVGYPIYMARKRMKITESIRIEPNVVPCGFVNTDHANYEELKDLLPGVTSRVSEIPESSYLVTVTPGLKPSLIAICEKRSIDLRPLSGFREP